MKAEHPFARDRRRRRRVFVWAWCCYIIAGFNLWAYVNVRWAGIIELSCGTFWLFNFAYCLFKWEEMKHLEAVVIRMLLKRPEEK